VAALATPVVLLAQTAHRPDPVWSVDVSLGGFAPGNRSAVTHWLARNGYGAPEPKHCGFDLLLQSVCDPPDPYPKVSGSQVLGWTIGVRRVLSDRVSVELLAATEQSGTVVGRCDDSATPRDQRCTDRFMTLDFGGASIGTLGVWKTPFVHVGAGPAMLFANWEMQPAHLAGIWFDARFGHERIPVFAHAQYRVYQSASLSPSQHFTSFHPQTLLLGMGVLFGFDESQP
jgi:hypothetical protein